MASNSISMQFSIGECIYHTQRWSQTAENEKVLSVEDDNECSSYATGYSNEGDMEPLEIAETENRGEGLTTMIAAIEAIGATQATVIEKLNVLERALATVQFDMTWVRDDIKGVHNVMENIADQVCGLKDASAKVDRLCEQVLVNANPKQTWRGDTEWEDCLKAPSASPPRSEAVCLEDKELCFNYNGHDVVNYIEET